MGLPLGVFNAVMNLVVWATSTIVARLAELMYGRLSARELSKRGSTTSTDAAEINVSSLLLGGAGPLCRKGRAWWAFGLLFALTALVPLELLVELGIDSSKRCTPYTKSSTGVCAAPWGGHSYVGIASAALLTQRFAWVDANWEVVLVGSSKIPVAAEVRTQSALQGNRRVIASNCSVSISQCGSVCRHLHIQRKQGAFDTVVTNADIAPTDKEVFRLGDVTYDKETSLAFIFWDAGTIPLRGRRRTGILANGIEVVLNASDTKRLLSQEEKNPVPWSIRATASNARRYNVFCETDGLRPKDLAIAVSLYRTTQMEQPGVRRAGVDGRIDRVPPLSASDAAKALYALKSSDWSGNCAGKLEVYSECGQFLFAYVAPFFCAAVLLAVLWAAVSLALKRVDAKVPHDARAWREQAHKLVQIQETPVGSLARNASGEQQGDAALFEPSLFDLQQISQRRRQQQMPVYRSMQSTPTPYNDILTPGYDEYDEV